MGLKTQTQKATKSVTVALADAVTIAKHSVKDAVSEEEHIEAAHAEREKRERSSLSPLSEVKSVGAELGDDVLADVDSIKQNIRKDI